MGEFIYNETKDNKQYHIDFALGLTIIALAYCIRICAGTPFSLLSIAFMFMGIYCFFEREIYIQNNIKAIRKEKIEDRAYHWKHMSKEEVLADKEKFYDELCVGMDHSSYIILGISLLVGLFIL